MCKPAAIACDTIVEGAIDCATKINPLFNLLDDLQEELVEKVTDTLMKKIGCPTRRLFGVEVTRRLFNLKKTVSVIAKKAGSIIKDVACSAVKNTCSPACSAGITTLAGIVSTYGIPASCASGILTEACTNVCLKACKRRRFDL